AVALMMLLLYLESKKGYTSLKTTIWYLLPVGIHSAVIYFIGLRFLFPLIKKVTLAKSLFVLLGFPVLFNLVPWLANLIGWTYLQSFIRKIEVYSDNSSYSQFFNTTLTMRLYVGIVLMVLFVLLYLGIVNSLKTTDDWRFSFVTMTYYVTLLSMGSIPFRNIYDRNLFLLLPMIVVSTYILFTYRYQLKILTNRNIVYGLTMGILCLSCAVGAFYNNNFPFTFIDFSKTDLLLKNIFQFFSNLPFT
ncbi:TPA: polymerase, partial [Streptococcus pneumoniae]